MELYIIYAIAAMLLYGITAIIYKIASPSIDTVSLTLFTSVFITASVFVYWLFFKEKMITMKGLEYSALAGVMAAAAFISFVTAIYLGKVSIAATIRGLAFAVTATIAILLLSEQVTTIKLLGIGLAVVAVILLSL
jgi:uncharacterized membrane protein